MSDMNRKNGLLSRYIGDRAFYKATLAVFLPIMLQNGITNFVGLLDNIMVGQIGTEQMTGVAIANQLMAIFNLCIFGGLSGAGIFGAQYFGQKNDEGARYTIRFKIWICIGLLAIFTAVFLIFREPLIRLFLSEEGDKVGDLDATLRYSSDYLNIMIIGMYPFALSQIYSTFLREDKETLLPMIASTTAVLTNLFFNYVLIFGHFGAPAMGCIGAAVATLISRVVEVCIVVVVPHLKTAKYTVLKGLYRSLRIPKNLVKKMTVTSFPLLLNEALWSLAITVVMQCYSVRGLAAVAAVNICGTVANLFNIFFFACGASISIIVGQLLGAGKIEEARDTDRKLIAFAAAGSVVTGLLLAASSPFIPKIYNTADSVRTLATQMMLVLAASMPIHAFNHSCYFTMRSGGQTVITFFFDSVYTWVVNVTLAFTLSRFTDMPIVWIYFCIQFSEIIKTFIGGYLVHKGVWAHNVVGTPQEDIT